MAIISTGVERRKRFALASAGGVLLTGVALVLLNVVSSWLYLRVDLTHSGAYSLSPSTKKMIRQLDDPIVIKAFFTPDLPAPYDSNERYVRDLLTEYRAASHGRIKFEFALPNPPKDFEERAMEAGMAPLEFNQVGNDQFQVRRGFMGLVMYYHDHSETIPVVKSVENFEYDVTSRIAKMSHTHKKVIAVTTGHGETEWRTPQFKLSEDLSDLYTFQTESLPHVSSAPLHADALLVVGPKQKFDDRSLWDIDQAIMRGIPVAFLLDSKNVMIQRFLASPVDAGLAPLLAQYGVKIGDRLVYDSQCETVTMTQNVFGMALNTNVRYKYIPIVTRFPDDQPITQGLEAIGLAFSSSLDPVAQPAVKFVPMFLSSPQSWLAPASTSNLGPDAVPEPTDADPRGPFFLGALLQGNFTSYFNGKPAPVGAMGTLIGSSPKNNIFVLTTSHVLDPNIPAFPGADSLMTNLLATLSQDETLVGIHRKGDILKPLKPVSFGVRQFVRFLAVLGVPLLAILYGVWRWRRRQSWRRMMSAAFAVKTSSTTPAIS